jgi:stearoyl-CoA 9-desaturase NADPH oxidoreductase
MFSAASVRLQDFTREFDQLKERVQGEIARRIVPVLDRASTRFALDAPVLDSALARLDPTLSLSAIRARVESIVDETHDTKTYWLRPNARFGTFRAGGHLTLQLRIAGRPVERTYSLSSAPRSDGLISITVKRVAGGQVSNWLADTLRPGSVLTLSDPRGEFVLPRAIPQRLLMLSAGSGVTPVMSMLRQLVADGSATEVVFLHFARSPRDIIFRDELDRIAQSHPNIRVAFCVEAAGGNDAEAWFGAQGRFCAQLLEETAPDFRTLDTYLCGPPAFMRNVVQVLEAESADLSKLRFERFSTAVDASMFSDQVSRVRFVRSGFESVSNRPGTLLEQIEGAGIPLASGCRAGNCGTCRSRKLCGVVVDVTTGLESGPGEQFIYPCVSVARGSVEMDL